jgi:hypothetical protein
MSEALVIPPQNEISVWSEEKRKDFVGLFAQRTDASYRITLMTAEKIMKSAQSRRIFSTRHTGAIRKRMGGVTFESLLYHRAYEPDNEKRARQERSHAELSAIATERSEAILDNLPSVQKAMAIIKPEVVRWMLERDKLKLQAEKFTEDLENSAEVIRMSSHRDMKVGAFLDMIQKKDEVRQTMLDKLNKVAARGRELESRINKALYRGIPGLSEAVIDCIISLYESATAMTEMNRRVEERIQYGDSEKAVELLKGFEKDEKNVSEDIKERLAGALDKLKLKGKKPARKAIKGRGKRRG